MSPKFPSLKAWKASGEHHAMMSCAPRPDQEMTEAARQTRIAVAEESTRLDAEMLAMHVMSGRSIR